MDDKPVYESYKVLHWNFSSVWPQQLSETEHKAYKYGFLWPRSPWLLTYTLITVNVSFSRAGCKYHQSHCRLRVHLMPNLP